ncbi:MAG: N-acetyltransferase [Ruminiclostridium sp.]|nr:N-acetyltransferase [Ruminiclostridium sp.]
MYIRKSILDDLPDIEKIYTLAREQMRRSGNPTQWGSTHPSREMIISDIDEGVGYVVVNGGEICGVFAFIVGDDPTYDYIKGNWLNNEKYGTIHRIAGNGREKGIQSCALDFCRKIEPNIRIDTHSDNKIMQHLLEKHGFVNCGIIIVGDGTPRIAYQRQY